MPCGWRRRESIAGVAAKVVGVIVVVSVAWLALWSFGNDVGGGSVVVGDGSARGCGDGGVVGGGGVVAVIWLRLVVEAIVVVVMVAWLALWLWWLWKWWLWKWWLRCGWSKITIEKEKPYLKGSQPG